MRPHALSDDPEQQFVIQEPDDDDDDDEPSTSSLESQTESLLASSSSAPRSISPSEKHPSSPTRTRRTHPDSLPLANDPGLALRRRGGFAGHWKAILAGLSVLFLGAWGLTQLLSLGMGVGQEKVQFILLISDGMGPASETLSRSFLQFLSTTTSSTANSTWHNLSPSFSLSPIHGMTPLDEMLIGASRTRSTSSLVTDSAAGATAFSCAQKTYNGAIAVSPNLSPCGTVLESAKRKGFSTGLVTTSRITHATPAAFYAHVVDRDLESEIATFLVGDGPMGMVVDIALGGGHCFFLGNGTEGSCRTDGQDLMKKAEEREFTVLTSGKELENWGMGAAAKKEGPVVGLFASGHMSFAIDREHVTDPLVKQPSLKEMTTHALNYLTSSRASPKGFFLMVEGARIDHAGHDNDPIGHVGDMLAYHETVQYINQWADDQNKKGIKTYVVSVSDHETGGLALARQLGTKYPEYAWYPDALINATHSTEFLGALVASQSASGQLTRDSLQKEVIETGLGVTDVSSEEVDTLWAVRRNGYRANRVLADIISRRAQIGWSTAGHSGVDVNLYASGFNATGLAGNRENTEIGDHIVNAMGLDLVAVTKELSFNLAWHRENEGKVPVRTESEEHYHGDH